jgi:ABC-type antimicrobial peptide transport system permease subunit
MAMLKRLLFNFQHKRQLFLAAAGTLLGLTFLLLSTQFLVRIMEFGEGSDMLGSNAVIVQKKVTNTSSLNLNKTDFTENEIKKIKAMPFIEDVQPVISNSFDVSFETADPMVPRFRTDVFIQTVPAKFLDVKTNRWSWNKKDAFLPIILPRDFLVMLNTFMSANGIPQVSDDLAKQIKFRFTLKKDGKKEWVNAKIIGFTNEVSAILVPEEFMAYGNATYGYEEEPLFTQLMIASKKGAFGSLEKMLGERGLEAKNAQLMIGRLKSIVGTLFFVVFLVSIMAVIASALVLIQYMQLLTAQNAYEIRTLIRLGYKDQQLVSTFLTYFVRLFLILSAVAFLTFWLASFYIQSLFESGGLYLNPAISWFVALILCISSTIFAIVALASAKREINRQHV